MGRAVSKYVVAVCFALSVSGVGANELPANARTLVDGYFVALQTGDTLTMSQMMDTRLRSSMGGVLDHPNYAAELAKDNSDRSFRIVGSRQTSGGILEVDFEAEDASETIRKRLYLVPDRQNRGSYLILQEQVIP